MKKRWMSVLRLTVVAAGLAMTLGSCTVDGWGPLPPTGWNTFYDQRLNGKWQLVQANGRPVTGYAVNYMAFYGSGSGMYYYYSQGYPYRERMAYWCQQGGSVSNQYEINIQYEGGGASTMNYWFTDGGSRLWMSWMDGGSTVTYVYAPVSYINW